MAVCHSSIQVYHTVSSYCHEANDHIWWLVLLWWDVNLNNSRLGCIESRQQFPADTSPGPHTQIRTQWLALHVTTPFTLRSNCCALLSVYTYGQSLDLMANQKLKPQHKSSAQSHQTLKPWLIQLSSAIIGTEPWVLKNLSSRQE